VGLRLSSNGAGYSSTLAFSNEVDASYGLGLVGSSLVFASGLTTERMRITSAGNVGIGTTNPLSILHLTTAGTSNNIQMTGSGTASVYVQRTNTGGTLSIGLDNSTGSDYGGAAYSGNVYMSGAYPMLFWTSATERMRIDSSGNVGIGTSSPNGKVDIVSSSAGANTNTLFLTNSSGTAGTATSLVFGVGSDPTNRQAVIRGINAGGNAINLAFLTSNADAPAERMRIDSSGNLLVGTTATGGSTSNSADVVAGRFSSISGAALNTTINVAADLVTLPSNYGTIILTAKLGGVGSPADADSVAIISVNAGTASQTNLKTGAWVVISLNGLTVRATQNQASSLNIGYTAIRIG
jgi:hypothetical protein